MQFCRVTAHLQQLTESGNQLNIGKVNKRKFIVLVKQIQT